MYPGEFETTFRKISTIFTIGSVADNKVLRGKLLKRNPEIPIWDTVESMDGFEGIDLGNGKYVSCKNFFKKPIRILFFILIHEFESRLYRVHRRNGEPLKKLDNLYINDLIRNLIENEKLMNLQDIYESRTQFKEDLKAISSFRNVIVHTNRRLEDEVDMKTIIQRKKQIFALLEALQQISDKMERKDNSENLNS